MRQPSSNILQLGIPALVVLASSSPANIPIANAQSFYKHYISFLGSTNNKYSAVSVTSKVGNTILDDVNKAFWHVSEAVLNDLGVEIVGDRDTALIEKERIGSVGSVFGDNALGLFESVHTNVQDVDCPDGLIYASPPYACLEFTYTLVPLSDGPLEPSTMLSYRNGVQSAINDGDLYNLLRDVNPDSKIMGLGNPGDGIPFDPANAPIISGVVSQGEVTVDVADIDTEDNNEDGDSTETSIVNDVATQSDPADESNTGSKGLSVGGIIGIAVSGGLIVIAILYAIVKERMIKENEQSAADPCRDLKEKARKQESDNEKVGVETAV